MRWEEATIKDDSSVEIPEQWLYLHYYETLSILFRIENALRIFVYIILKSNLNENWTTINIVSDDSEETTIAQIARRRIGLARKHGYLGYNINCPVMHLTTGELIRLITSEGCWKYFTKYFPGSKQIIESKLEEINTVRNSLAHFRPIQRDDLALIKQNARHVLIEVEKCLNNVFTSIRVVPTNTDEEWYKELRTIGTDLCSLRFFMSDDEQWIKMWIDHKCTVLKHTRLRNNVHSYIISKLETPKILLESKYLMENILYLSEGVPYIPAVIDDVPEFSKIVKLNFSREVIIKEYADIKKEIERVLSIIIDETELIKEDHLAKGNLIEPLHTFATYNEQDNQWDFGSGHLKSKIDENSPPEYWGEVAYYEADIITDIGKYPWMPVSISEGGLPF